MKKILLLIVSISFIATTAMAGSLFKADFSHRMDGDAREWLQADDWTFQAGASKIRPLFQNGKLMLTVKEDQLGLLVKRVELEKAKKLIIRWGVNEYPAGADWDKGLEREAIMVSVNFGKEVYGSGVLFFPSLPRYIGIFLGEKEQAGKEYKGRYYKKSSSYYCVPCGAKTKTEITTEIDLEEYYQKSFGEKLDIPVTGISIEFDTRKQGKAEAFVRSIEILSE